MVEYIYYSLVEFFEKLNSVSTDVLNLYGGFFNE